MNKARTPPSPGIGPDNADFIAAAREGRFMLRWCNDCGKTHWYPRALCPHCMSANTQWKPASGRGTVYSYSTMTRVDPPYSLAYVTLAEGPTMLTHLLGDGPYRIGMPVQVQFVASDDGTPVPMFSKA